MYPLNWLLVGCPSPSRPAENLLRWESKGLVVVMVVAREHIKALVDRLTDEQAQALWVLLNSMTWPEEELTTEEIAEVEEARAEIRAGKGIKAGDIWRELGI